MSMELISIENFIYGRRTKATISHYRDREDIYKDIYKVTLYNTGKVEYASEVYSNYNKAYLFANNWLNSCKY